MCAILKEFLGPQQRICPPPLLDPAKTASSPRCRVLLGEIVFSRASQGSLGLNGEAVPPWETVVPGSLVTAPLPSLGQPSLLAKDHGSWARRLLMYPPRRG